MRQIMAGASVEQRLAALESEVAELKRRLAAHSESDAPWLDARWGAFAGDPAHAEAMRLGAQWRKRENAKSLRRPKKKRRNVRS
jgi:hypothetical protein